MLFLGTAGWSVPASVGGTGSQLERYARVLNAVEINSSFRKVHRRATYERWARVTPETFRFSVKLPKAITHASTFANDELEQFLENVGGLGDKLAVLLVQFPPSRAFDTRAVQVLSDALRQRTSAAIACEPRHASWFAEDVSDWLAERHITRVAADPSRAGGADVPGGWGGLRYFRLHGSPKVYYSAYDEKFLRALNMKITPSGKLTWCVFDNTVLGAAFENAKFMTALAGDHLAG
jgi:uncharacterized protein YecE (DUF72 family)